MHLQGVVSSFFNEDPEQDGFQAFDFKNQVGFIPWNCQKMLNG